MIEDEYINSIGKRENEYKEFIKDVEAGPVREATFCCPDCLTIITIKTTLSLEYKPFRIACPCKYSALHRITDWEIKQ